MFSPLAPWVARIHQETLLEEARKNQIAARGRNRSAQLGVRMLVGLGVFLISLGLRLHERHQREMRPVPGSCGPVCG